MKEHLKLKSCPRCRGDLHFSSDMYGDFVECLQCGYMKDLQRQPWAALALKAQEKAKKVA